MNFTVTRKRIVLSVFLCLALCLPQLAQAWSFDGHQLVTEFALMDVVRRYGLDRPVEVTLLSSFLRKFYQAASESRKVSLAELNRKNLDPASSAWFKDFLLLNPDIDLDYAAKDEKPGMKIRPIDILIRHSTDPDDGRDQNLNVHRYQSYFGGTEGPSSQAFRHMEKPAFLVFNYKSTIGLPLGRAGEASQRAHIYFNLARIARELGDEYWMWRFLACSFHYTQDLTQPYHTTEISSNGVLWRRARQIRKSGTAASFRNILANLITNSHHWFESYSSTIMKLARSDYLAGRPDKIRPEIKSMFTSLRGQTTDPKQGSIRKYAVEIRNTSNRRAPDLLESVFHLSDDRLRGMYEYNQDLNEVAPLQFVSKTRDDVFRGHEARFFEIINRSYQLAGVALRTAVDELEKPREPRTLGRLVEEIVWLRK